jgi:hypothetical protein
VLVFVEVVVLVAVVVFVVTVVVVVVVYVVEAVVALATVDVSVAVSVNVAVLDPVVVMAANACDVSIVQALVSVPLAAIRASIGLVHQYQMIPTQSKLRRTLQLEE